MKGTRILIALLVSLVPALPAQEPDPDARYLLLSTRQTSTMEKELSAAAARGYRILVGSPTSGVEMALLLERVATPPETYTYKLLATTRTGTMQRELDEASQAGFRLLPTTMISKRQMIGGEEVVVVLERPPKVEKRYSYRLLATTRTATLQKEITDALAAGYVLAGMVSRGEHMVIMEKEAPASE
jgi:hypothetical protein